MVEPNPILIHLSCQWQFSRRLHEDESLSTPEHCHRLTVMSAIYSIFYTSRGDMLAVPLKNFQREGDVHRFQLLRICLFVRMQSRLWEGHRSGNGRVSCRSKLERSKNWMWKNCLWWEWSDVREGKISFDFQAVRSTNYLWSRSPFQAVVHPNPDVIFCQARMNGEVSCTGHSFFASTCSVTCNTGYELTGVTESKAQCNELSQWDGNLGVCASMFLSLSRVRLHLGRHAALLGLCYPATLTHQRRKPIRGSQKL